MRRPQVKTILTNCTVIDCTGEPPRKDMTVVIEGDKIAELNPGAHKDKAGEGERVFDLEGSYVLPGLWSAHTHLGDLFPDTARLMHTESAIDCAIRGGRNAMDALRQGITGIRLLGDRDFIDMAWKRAFDAGVFVGPRLFVCGSYICATGGFGHHWPGAVQVDGPDVFYVPTMVMHQDQALLYENGFLETDPRDRKRSMEARFLIAVSGGVSPEYSKAHLEGFQKALKAGVKIACGGDPTPIGEYSLLEIEHLVRAGMTEMEALIAATRTCADLCNVVDQLGTVEVGKLADLIVVSANPLEDISNIRKLKLVLKGGNLVDTSAPEGLGDFWELFVLE